MTVFHAICAQMQANTQRSQFRFSGAYCFDTQRFTRIGGMRGTNRLRDYLVETKVMQASDHHSASIIAV